MPSFPLEFKAGPVEKTPAIAFSFHVHGVESPEDAKRVLAAQLTDVLTQLGAAPKAKPVAAPKTATSKAPAKAAAKKAAAKK